MEAMENIITRRSIRRYTDEPVTREDIKRCVEAARFAPSWKNTQTTRYIAVFDREMKERIANECVCGFEFNRSNINSAAALIVETTVEKRSGYEKDGSFSTTKGTHWQSFDAGIAAEAFCLAAHDLGLGTVILGVFDEQKVKEVVNVPEGQSISALILIGHSDQNPKAPLRKEVEELISYR